jgi:serine/threonine protein kinase
VPVLYSFAENGLFYLIMPRYAMTLSHYTQEHGVFDENDVRTVAKQLLLALKVLHKRHIVHRDLKLQNVLLERDDLSVVAITDFGLSRLIERDVALGASGTAPYMSPEQILHQPQNVELDIWSLGVILFRLATGEFPFYDDNRDAMNDLICDGEVLWPEDLQLSKHARSFIESMFVPAKHRPSAAELLDSTWLHDHNC